MATKRKRLGELLVSLRLLSSEQLEQALAAKKDDEAPLGTVLVQLGFISEELLLNALAAQIGVWPWRLEERPPDPKAVKLLPAEISKAHQILPVEIRSDLLVLAMVNPLDIMAIERVRTVTGMRIEPVLADAQRLAKAIDDAHGGGRKRLTENLDELVEMALKDFNVSSKSKSQAETITDADTRPVVGLVNQLIVDAIRAKASDIHIEPRADRVDVRYRIDGQLIKGRDLPSSLLPMLTTRLKIMAEIDIVEFRIPQDGRISVQIDGRNVDLRMSVLPNHYGQRIVLRILDKSFGIKMLDELGFTERHLALFRSLVSKPYGMFLVTGPTGSGKTTTLYAAPADLRSSTNNIMTCEDPIEYDIDGINQSQVNEKVGLTFAKQLRATLRQDPDVILVGEIRDGETAQTAIRASLTGHMVLSTLHCNDAPSAIPRLLDMDVDPFLLSTSLIGVMSQRLLRKVCRHCAEDVAPSESDLAILEAYGAPVPVSVKRAKGCPECHQTGYSGRWAIHEIMPVVPAVARLLAARESIDTICEAATAFGYVPMQIPALAAVILGETTMDEAQRVVFLDATYAEMQNAAIGLRAA